jgi:Icc-related predicted phosphoesterase
MKILAISDEVVASLYDPRIREKFADVSLVIGCGDLPYYYLEFIVTLLDVPLYYVPGNHDRPRQYLSDGRIIDHAQGCEPLDGQVVSLAMLRHHSPLLLAGLGGCLRYNMDASHQYTQSEMTSRALQLAPALALNRLRYGRALDIFVAHAPPRGIHDAEDLAHTGFDVFLRLMDAARPRYLLHGHSHVYRSDAVTQTRYKDTTVVNVYPYRVIEW